MTLMFNPKRWRQWAAVVGHEFTLAGMLPMITHMIKAAPGLLRGTRKQFRSRMRSGCLKCPIYNRDMKTCRPFIGASLGCGCYAPFLCASDGATCWAHTSVVCQKAGIAGWPAQAGTR